MITWKLIDRATGAVLKTKTEDSMTRVLNKPKVWLPVRFDSRPVYDADTHKLQASVAQPDLSDLSTDVDPEAVRVEGWSVTALSSDELADRKVARIKDTDRHMLRMVEDVMVALATGKQLKRASFPAELWEKINTRRRLRGLEDV